ncbi:MAG: SusC/RagA family TonB-linked outer membrane protein, partial [Bacteroidales bacterium]
MFTTNIQIAGQTTYTISGTISDSTGGETLIGVNVYLSYTEAGTVTNARGDYSISVPAGKHTLVFSYVGYNRKEIVINAAHDQTLNILMQQSKTNIGEVQITAQRKFFGNMEYGRDIPSIDAKTIESLNENNASDILHARLAGVWATKTSGAPGDHEKIRIRGQSSFFSSAEPLYVVDGVPVPIVNMSSLGIADLNIHDIESVTVLKDASSTSLYGFQGGNGVVLIDTKKGGGKPRYTFITKQGISWQSKYYDLMNTKDFLTSLDSSYSKLGIPIRGMYPAMEEGLCNDDWQDRIFSRGYSQEYQFSAAGSVKSFNYYFSGNYTDQSGTLPDSRYTRSTFSVRISRSFFKKLVVDLGYRGSWQANKNNQDRYQGNQLIFEGISKAPCLRCTPDSLLYTEEGALKYRTYYPYYIRLSNPELPESIMEDSRHNLRITSNILNLAVRMQINDQLHMDVMESFMNRPSLYNSKFVSFSYAAIESGQKELRSDENVILFNHQVSLGYNNDIKDHHVGILLAHRYYKDNLWWKVDSIQGSIPEHYTLKNSMSAYGLKGSVLRKINSYILHLSYNYRKIYFLSAITNLSHVKEGLYTDNYALFPSLALSWDLLQQFNITNSRLVNHFEIYANWGQSGNYPLNGLANDLYRYVPYSFDSISGYAPVVSQLANHKLKHENTSEVNVGFRSSFLDNRISLSAVYYKKNITNLILLRDIPYYYGSGKQYTNIGEVCVSGYEAGLELVPIKTSVFYWQLLLNYSNSKPIVEKLVDDQELSFIDGDILMPDFYVKEGDPPGNIYGYKYLGKIHPEDREGDHDDLVFVYREKYLNADSSDSELNDRDKIVIGNSTPKFLANFSSTFSYKNLSLDFAWYAVLGVKKYNATRAATYLT